MGTSKVGVYRKYHGTVPKDAKGRPLPKSVWQDKRPFSWAVRWFGDEGHRYSKSFDTRKHAERFAEKMQQEVRHGAPDPPDEITLDEFIKEHGKVMEGQVAEASLYDQMRALGMFMGHVGRHVRLSNLRSRDAESFISARLKKVAIGTANKDIRTLKAVFNVAIERRKYLRVGQNPFAAIKERKQAAKVVRYIAHDEFQKLMDTAPTAWWKALLAMLYSTAGRLGEIMNLTWADVDFNGNQIRIVTKDASQSLFEWEPKDHEARILSVPADAMKLLSDLRADGSGNCPYVFIPESRWEYVKKELKAKTWEQGKSVMNNMNRDFGRLRERAGVAHLTFHDFRRTCITNWARKIPAHVVKTLAGHSDIKTTLKYYVAIQQVDLDDARRVQEEILRGTPTDPKLTQKGQNGGGGETAAA